jgi:hypothetical protein
MSGENHWGMASAPKKAAGKWCLITGRKQRVTKHLRNLILLGIPVTFQMYAVTI